VPVVERNPHDVEALLRDEGDIGFGNVGPVEGVEEGVVPCLSQDFLEADFATLIGPLSLV
jgi:hypothetical protein